MQGTAMLATAAEKSSHCSDLLYEHDESAAQLYISAIKITDIWAKAVLRGYGDDTQAVKPLLPEKMQNDKTGRRFADAGFHNIAALCAVTSTP